MKSDQPHEASVEVDGADVWYRVSGGVGPTLLLVHGSGANHLWWHVMLPWLRPGHRVVEMDLSGHGDSGHRLPYSVEGWAGEIDAVLQAVDARDAVLVGHSMGGKLCVAAAALHPQRVAGLVLFDVGLPPPRSWRDRPASFEGATRYFPTREELVARFALAPRQPHPAAHVLDPIAEGSVRHEAEGWRWKHDRRRTPIVDDRLIGTFALGLTCPISYVYAEHSHAVDEETVEHVRTSLRAPVTLTRVDGTHHHLVLEEPERCAELVVELAESLTR